MTVAWVKCAFRAISPEALSEWGEPVDPLANATKAERRAWSKKNQAKAMRAWSSTNVRYLLAHGRIQDANAILVLRTPSKAKWYTVRSAAAPSDSPPPILAPTLQATFRSTASMPVGW